VSRFARRLAAVAAALALSLSLTLTPTASAQAPQQQLPIGGFNDAVYHFIFDPDHVAGANNWSCTPSAEHPTPVVLVHATFVNLGTNWVDLSPRLANAGYCVYAFNYGMVSYSADRIGGLDDIADSAHTLKRFVDQVLRRTGAEQVDLVGHSQGGMMPNYYIKRLGGADKVRRFVAIAPSNHGTTVSGLTTFLPEAWGQIGSAIQSAFIMQVAKTAPGLTEQIAGSKFQKRLFGDGDTVPGPQYTVIATNRDWVVTPYPTQFLNAPNVDNVLLQDRCPTDTASHIGLFDDEPTMQLVLNALGPDDPHFQPECTGFGQPY
jgi:pimeloyl-ACP methyl ester carboxylesterase